MSRSRRKTPIVGHTTCRSEREDKKLWHQRWRTHERTALASASPDALSAHLPLLENQVSNVWSMGNQVRKFNSLSVARSDQRIADVANAPPHGNKNDRQGNTRRQIGVDRHIEAFQRLEKVA